MKNARPLVFAAVLLLAALVAVPAAARAEGEERAAVAAADAWLKIVDAGHYATSWDEAATLFRNAVGKSDWERQVKSVRAPLGKLVARKVGSRTYTESLPGAPDGKYVVVQYETSFENKKRAIETVTPMLDSDGRWRVSGYFIK